MWPCPRRLGLRGRSGMGTDPPTGEQPSKSRVRDSLGWRLGLVPGPTELWCQPVGWRGLSKQRWGTGHSQELECLLGHLWAALGVFRSQDSAVSTPWLLAAWPENPPLSLQWQCQPVPAQPLPGKGTWLSLVKWSPPGAHVGSGRPQAAVTALAYKYLNGGSAFRPSASWQRPSFLTFCQFTQ